MLYLIILSAFLAVLGAVYSGLSLVFARRLHMQQRLLKIQAYNRIPAQPPEGKMDLSLRQRLLRPLADRFFLLLQRFISLRRREQMVEKLLAAGNPGGLTSAEFIVLYYLVILLGGGLGLLAGIPFLGSRPLVAILYVILGIIVGRLLMEYFLTSRARKRSEAITKELPDVLDLLSVSVEAGLGFDAAMQRVVEKTRGPLGREFSFTLQEIRLGKTRRQALKDLMQRSHAEDLNTFISAIVQAEQMGVGIGNVLRIQAGQMRQKRRQRAEEQAMKAPVKMLFPMILFIFPALFIVLLGPAVIQIARSLNF